MNNNLTIQDAFIHYKRLNTTWGYKYDDPEYGPEIFFEVFEDLDRDLVAEGIHKALQTEHTYPPDMSQLRGFVTAIRDARKRDEERVADRCSLCQRPESHALHDLSRGERAHAYDPPKPRRANRGVAPQTIARPWRAGLKADD